MKCKSNLMGSSVMPFSAYVFKVTHVVVSDAHLREHVHHASANATIKLVHWFHIESHMCLFYHPEATPPKNEQSTS